MTLHSSRHRGNAARDVLWFLAGHWRRNNLLAAATAAGIVAATLADVLMPLFAGRLIDAVAQPAQQPAWRAAIVALLAMAALGAVAAVLRTAGTFGTTYLTLRIMTAMVQTAFSRVQRFSADWHANSFAGSIVRQVTRGIWAVDLLDDTLLFALLPALAVLVAATLLLGFRWPLLGMLVALGSLAYVSLTVGFSLGVVMPAARLSNKWDTRMGGALADAIACNTVVKAFGTEAREDARLAAVVAKWRARTRRTWERGAWSGAAQMALLLALRTGVIGVALLLWRQGRATPGDVAYVLTMYFVIHGYLRDIGTHVANLQRSVNEMEELVAIHATPLGVADRSEARPIRVGAGGIVFDRVGFRYGDHTTPLFQDLSVVIRPGERVGLVGRSGSGKTTFVKLIQRLYDVTNGRVLIDGQDVATVAQASLRRQIGIVPQEPLLFHRSLAENISYARPDAAMAEIVEAAARANAHDFITRLPKGHATLVGERGVKLSGGERQRVALARAFLADAPILILDEATSSLDSESERLIQQAMALLMDGRTVLVIAHRLSTVRALDRILVFDRGRIVEQGSHASLMRENGLYCTLVRHQVLGMADVA